MSLSGTAGSLLTSAGANSGGGTAAAAAAAAAGSGSRDLWRAGYWVAPAQLPAFISGALASKILRAGKSINFLQVSSW